MSELRLSLRINAGAYGYSVMITCTLAILAAIHVPPAPGQIFLFLLGAAASFATVETIATRGFSRPPSDQERSDVVALGSSLSLVSIALGVAAAGLLGTILPETASWIVGPFTASITYLLTLSVEMSVARRIEESREVE
ncbi:hypothetical protein [Phytoactinopolyspora halophila]|nr:hypothetical protein [Phytoactinopolyspora halophila]